MPKFCLPNHINPEQFLTEYWQKKPLLIKNGLPELANFLEPDDIFELALADEVTARLITQDNTNPKQWQLDLSPFADDVIEHTQENTKLWTLLVQNLEQWSLEIAEQWQKFAFIPQWQQDDIMVSYAPKGGSVGMHYDEYDVFLAQGYGARRWQLGKFCDSDTPILPDQPLRLITDMGDIIFDEVLEAGDVLYVPPKLSHYGVAENDCLTFSFGLRRPNAVDLLDALVDELSQHSDFKIPFRDLDDKNQPQAGNSTISIQTFNHIKQQLIDQLTSKQGTQLLYNAITKTVTTRRFELIMDEELAEITDDELEEMLTDGGVLIKEPAVNLLFSEMAQAFYCQGEQVKHTTENDMKILHALANGKQLSLQDLKEINIDMQTVNGWLGKGILTIL